jgi:hypothetical protein
MATPSYRGVGQPIAQSTGVPSRLGSYFGTGGTPAYAGSGQPASTSQGLLAVSTPGYASAPVREPIAETPVLQTVAPCEERSVVMVEERPVLMCPIDPEALAAGQIAIVVSHQDK